MELGGKSEGTEQKRNRKRTHGHELHYGDCNRGRGFVKVEESIGEMNGNGQIQLKKGSVSCQGLGEKRIYRWSTEEFRCLENPLYDTILMNLSHYTLPQIYRMYKTTPRMNIM